VGQTGGGENGNLLTTSNGVHAVNGGQTSLNHFLRVDTGERVDGLTLDVQEVLGQDGGTLVDGLTGSVENTA